jgi:glyoxylase-like metal-dependent hydrolase (beta-lactamase superfamily II)
MIQLEDTYLDIIKKASVGHGLGEKKIAQLTKLPIEEISCFFKGKYCESTLKSLAQILHLDFPSLKNHANNSSHPPKISLEGLQQYQSTFTYRPNQTLSVNHYLLVDVTSKTTLLFDTGTDATASLEYLKNKSLDLTAIFITHQHKDHIWALNKYTERYPKPSIYAAKQSIDSQYTFSLLDKETPQTNGPFEIEASRTPGHTDDGISFKVTGLNQPVMFVGDALFAHSQGGIHSQENYKQALEINRSHILSHADDTILAPGHGPLTTVGHEKANNPFYANSALGTKNQSY